MARPIERRSRDALGTFRTQTNVPGLEVTAVPYFTPPKGLNTLANIARMPPEFTPELSNLILDQGVLKSRLGLATLGDVPADTIMAVVCFIGADLSGALIRLRVSGMDRWNGIEWQTVPDAVFTGTTADRFTWTGWKNSLLVCNGIDKIVEYDTLTGQATVLEESFPCKHLTSFSNRVIASAVTEGPFLGYRERWSVKNDHTDWTSDTTTDGIGAGAEDLLGGAEGEVDQLMGVFPLSDDTALMVRENSLWLQFVTGDVLAPFRFTRMAKRTGSRARHSIQITPFGVVMLSQNDVIIANQSGFQSLGEPIRRTLIASVADHDLVSSLYDPRRQEYRLIVNGAVWRYSFVDKGWTKDNYPFGLRHGTFVEYRSLGLTFDELEGTFDDLVGTFDEQVRDFEDESVHFVIEGQNQIARETEESSRDIETDSSISIWTGLLQAGSPLDKTEIIEAQVEYECSEQQSLVFEYSYNKGQTWQTYSTRIAIPTTGPTLMSVRKTLVSRNLQVRVRAATLGKLTLLGLWLFVVKGTRANP